MTARDILNNVVITATINADGDADKGTVSLILVEEALPDDTLNYRWYGLWDTDTMEWHDTETSGRTRDLAIQNALWAWAGDDWDLRIPGKIA